MPYYSRLSLGIKLPIRLSRSFITEPATETGFLFLQFLSGIGRGSQIHLFLSRTRPE